MVVAVVAMATTATIAVVAAAVAAAGLRVRLQFFSYKKPEQKFSCV